MLLNNKVCTTLLWVGPTKEELHGPKGVSENGNLSTIPQKEGIMKRVYVHALTKLH